MAVNIKLKQKVFEEISKYKNDQNEDSWIRAVSGWAELNNIPSTKLRRMLPEKLIEIVKVEAERSNLLKKKRLKKIGIDQFFKLKD